MSDTPETDAKQHFMYMDAVECVEIDFARNLERERDKWREIARIAVASRDHNRAMWDKCAAELSEILMSDK